MILDMRPVCTFTDFFVIATGRNSRQTGAIWDEVHTKMKQEQRLIPRTVDGTREGSWILADYLDVTLAGRAVSGLPTQVGDVYLARAGMTQAP